MKLGEEQIEGITEILNEYTEEEEEINDFDVVSLYPSILNLQKGVLKSRDDTIMLLKLIHNLMDRTCNTFENVIKKLNELDERLEKIENGLK